MVRRSGDEQVENLGQPSSGSQESSLSGLTRDQISQITLEITERLRADPSAFIDQVRNKSGDVRGLEQALIAQQVPDGYFFLEEESKTHNAQIKETKQMVHLSEFKKMCKDETSPKERQWLELCVETFKSQGIPREKAMAWVRYRIEPHHKVELRNQETKGKQFKTIEDIYNHVMVKFLEPETLDDVMREIRGIKQGPSESFAEYVTRLGEGEQKLWQICGATSTGKRTCSEEAQLARLESGLDADFEKYAREQSFRESRAWPTSISELTCLLNYYFPPYKKQLPKDHIFFTSKEEKEKPLTEKNAKKSNKDKKKGAKAFGKGKENDKGKENKRKDKERTPEAQAQWDDSNAKFAKLSPEMLRRVRTWHKKIKKLWNEGEDLTEELKKEAKEIPMCVKCRQYGHQEGECLQGE